MHHGLFSFLIAPMGVCPPPCLWLSLREAASFWDCFVSWPLPSECQSWEKAAFVCSGMWHMQWCICVLCSDLEHWWPAQLRAGRCWCWEPAAVMLASPSWLFKLSWVWTWKDWIILLLLEERFWSRWVFRRRHGQLSCLSWVLGRNKGLSSPWRRIQDFSLAQNWFLVVKKQEGS